MLQMFNRDKFDKFRICLDVDGPCAKQLQRWIDLYNKAYNDSLTEEDITHWNISEIVKPECGDRIHEFLKDPTFYTYTDPVDGFVEGVQKLRGLGYKITYVTSCPIGTADQKIDWILRHDPIATWKDIITCYEKDLIIGDVLVDDGAHNLEDALMRTVRFELPHNKGTAANAHVRTWAEMPDAIQKAIHNPFKYVERRWLKVS